MLSKTYVASMHGKNSLHKLLNQHCCQVGCGSHDSLCLTKSIIKLLRSSSAFDDQYSLPHAGRLVKTQSCQLSYTPRRPPQHTARQAQCQPRWRLSRRPGAAASLVPSWPHTSPKMESWQSVAGGWVSGPLQSRADRQSKSP